MLNKNFIRDYLSFSKKDRTGILAMIILILVIYLLPRIFGSGQKRFPLEKSKLIAAAVDSLDAREARSPQHFENNQNYRRETATAKDFRAGAMFRFDPNTISIQGWEALGLSERTSNTIEKYRLKGGKFYKSEDLQRIWGLPPGFYERVKDCVMIARKSGWSSPLFPKTVDERPAKRVQFVNINEADTSEFISLPGIGSKLASRIVSFRDRLGGFYSVDQLKEIYGLQDSVFQKIKPFLQGAGAVKKININTAGKDDFKSHPYFKWALANAIIEYRNQHGAFKVVDDLKKIGLIDEVIFRKLAFYAGVE